MAKSRKAKARLPQKSLESIFKDEWSGSDGYVTIADLICAILNLPDLTTRSGLKMIHADLNNILRRLDTVFRHAERVGNAMVMSGVISIYTKMCLVDALLQDKIVEKGLYERMVSLTASPEIRHVALRSINAIVYSSGKRMAFEFVRHASVLVQLLDDNPNDPAVNSLVPSIFAHAACSMYRELQALSEADASDLAVAVLAALRSPSATPWMIHHALSWLGSDHNSVLGGGKGMPSYTTLRVALLRSQDVCRRAKMMQLLMNDYAVHETKGGKSSHFTSKEISHYLDNSYLPLDLQYAVHILAPSDGGASKRQLPHKLQNILDKYGFKESQLYSALESNVTYGLILTEYHQQSNLLKFGRHLGSHILHNEYSVPVVLCSCCGDDKHLHAYDPSWYWLEMAQPCIGALRSKDGSHEKNDMLYADILEWRYLASKCCTVHVQAFAKGAVKRHPSCALFHYVLGEVHKRQTRQDAETLRIVKAGLRCSDIQPWIRRGLLRTSIIAAFHLSLKSTTFEECAAFILSAYEDSKALIKESTPDGFRRQDDLYTFILISFVVEGDKCDPLTPGIENALKEIKVNEEFLEFMGNPLTNENQSKLTACKIIDVMKDAIQEWDGMFKRSDDSSRIESEGSPLPIKDNTDESMTMLSAWLTKFEGGQLKDPNHYHKGHEGTSTLGDFARDRGLMNCAWCTRPSALLKKCKRCGIAKYCDAECQKAHWEIHKASCVEVAVPSNS